MDNQANILGELTDAKERIVKKPLNRIHNGSFVVDCSNPWVNTLRKLDQTLIKVYRNKILQCEGPIITTQKTRTSSSNTMLVNWAGIGWRLGTRLIEESKSNKGIEYGKPEAPIDVGQMVVKIINGLNNAPLLATIPGATEPNQRAPGLKDPYNVPHPAPPQIIAPAESGPLPQGDTGIRIGTVSPCPLNSVGPWYYQNALQAISMIASTFSGFDWGIEPVEPYRDSLGIVFGKLNIGESSTTPQFGKYRGDVFFEYGDGKNNVAEWTELIDATGLLNRAYAFPGVASTPEEEAAMLTVQQYDWEGISSRGTVYDDVIPSSVTTQDLRNALLQEQVTVRRNPKSVISFKPTADPEPGVMPEYESEFDLGDLFNFRAVEYGVETFNGICRLYEIEFLIDEAGNELMTPILVEQET